MHRIPISPRQIFMLLGLVSFCAGCHVAGSGRTITGSYRLELATDQAWHRHRLHLAPQKDPQKLTATLEFDRGIGPAGRSPTVDEVVHVRETIAHWSGESLRLEVQIGTIEKTVYRFVLKPCTQSSASSCEKAQDWFGNAFILSGDAHPPGQREGIPVRLILE
mgnify:CR=1 FL=1